MGVFTAIRRTESITITVKDIEMINEDSIIDFVLTMEDNYNRVYEQSLISIDNVIEQPILEGNFFENLILGIKKFLVHLWRFIAGMFKSFNMFLDKHMKDDREFLNKYRKQIMSKTLGEDFSFSGFIFTIDMNEINNAINEIGHEHITNPGTVSDISTAGNQYGQGKMSNLSEMFAKLDEEIELLRGRVLSRFAHCPNKEANRRVDLKGFNEEIFQCLRNGQDSVEDINNKLDVGAITTEMFNYNDARKTSTLAMKNGKRILDQADKDVQQRIRFASREVIENPEQKSKDPLNPSNANLKRTNRELHKDKLKEMSYFCTYVQKSRTVLTSLEGAVIGALKQRSKQNKNACIAVINYKPNEGTYQSNNESHIDRIEREVKILETQNRLYNTLDRLNLL